MEFPLDIVRQLLSAAEEGKSIASFLPSRKLFRELDGYNAGGKIREKA
jgi:hypothetical protein